MPLQHVPALAARSLPRGSLGKGLLPDFPGLGSGAGVGDQLPLPSEAWCRLWG
jgi:hypothetical protein